MSIKYQKTKCKDVVKMIYKEKMYLHAWVCVKSSLFYIKESLNALTYFFSNSLAIIQSTQYVMQPICKKHSEHLAATH